MDAQKIRAALKIVHESERGVLNPGGLTRVQAVELAIRTGPSLTHDEVDVLLRSVGVARHEITVQWKG